ncbi:MAG TPA: isoprenyl transferase [Candidatus Mcinerneyibacteriales bacterium]|nr:isoprenyl transferase [Candidatus Mcinerneyibacteriales bacterium]HPE19951.1 isoprenyl transferase [Candidatus Mcinerneyibacteriales bacterium]HPJ70393.1 isoprenyl transferase [Candidatus Mcinerneyibacteriales bacterium]
MDAPAPRHVAIIMDGNGRWARQRLLPRTYGHKKGVETLRTIVKAAAEKGIDVLTVFAFSTENWKRPEKEVRALMHLFVETLEKEVPELMDNNVKLRFIGDRAPLSHEVVEKMTQSEARTKDNEGLTLVVAINYSGRNDILRAVKAFKERKDSFPQLDEELFASFLDTRGLPDPDLIIRTGGEYRISNFLLWQGAYSEFYSTAAYWPDFSRKEFEKALKEYTRRDRRFGGLG